jgi:hypothetical protein
LPDPRSSRAQALKDYAKERRDVEFEDLEVTRTENTAPIVKYFDNAETFEMWSKESQAMYDEAAAICEEMGWSIYDAGGGLWYKPGLGARQPSNQYKDRK